MKVKTGVTVGDLADAQEAVAKEVAALTPPGMKAYEIHVGPWLVEISTIRFGQDRTRTTRSMWAHVDFELGGITDDPRS